MAAIGTIRKYSGIAVGFIGISILAFVISDGLGTGSSIFGGNDEVVVGEMAGHTITYQDFENRFNQELETLKALQQRSFVDEETKGRLRQEVWNLFQNDYVFEKEYHDAKLKLSDEELMYIMAGPEPHAQVKQMFMDPKTKSFDKNQLLQFLENFDDADPLYQKFWVYVERIVYTEKAYKKYENLLSSSMYVTKLEAEDKFFAKNKMATFEYVTLPTRDVADSIAENMITEADIQKKYDEIKEQHKVEKSRIAQYVKFDITPTSDDTLRAFNKLAKIVADTTKVKSSIGWLTDTAFHSPGFYEDYVDNVYFNGNYDSVIGPYIDGNYYKIAKLIEKETVDSVYYYKARHILIRPKGNTDADTLEAMNKAREILKRLKDGENFQKMVLEESDDEGSKVNGGDLGWFAKGKMVPAFYNGVKNLRKGEMTVVKSQFGAHVIEATEDKNNLRIKVGFIAEPIIASEATRQVAYDKANDFRVNVNNLEDFENYTSENQIEVNETKEILVTQENIAGLENPSGVLGWMFRDETKLYDVSEIFDAKNAYVVAVLTDATEKGYAPLEKLLEAVIKPNLMNDKKLEYQAEKMKEAAAGKSDLKSIADALGTTVVKVPSISFDAPYLPNAGQEQKLVGAVMAAQPEMVNGPVLGENGVYMFQLMSFNDVQVPENFDQEKTEIQNNIDSYTKMKSQDVLTEQADIQDNRYKFNFN